MKQIHPRKTLDGFLVTFIGYTSQKNCEQPMKGAFQTFLAHHPHLHKPHRLDEVHFFDKDEEYEKGLDHYLKIMPNTFKKEVTYEKTPKYLVHPDAACE